MQQVAAQLVEEEMERVTPEKGNDKSMVITYY